ncbi:MAG: urease accessory protein UreF [Verrucomicrobia bacterium]|nr:urease accessory protein UreF [Verrucomicrobiota bacterium]
MEALTQQSAIDQRFLTSASGRNDWLVWQLADSAFPTGSFAHSAGLEAAWQHGEVRNRVELVSFLEASLRQLGHSSLPFVATAHAEPERLEEFDELCDAFTTNHVANRASRLQGKAFFTAVERIVNVGQASSLPVLAASCRQNDGTKMPTQPVSRMSALQSQTTSNDPSLNWAGWKPALRYFHYAPVFGAVTNRLGLNRELATRLFFFSHLRSLLAAAVRLNVVGPMDAQAIQLQLSSHAEAIRTQCERLALDDIAQTSPLLDLWQGTQDRLYSRLFQS